MTLIMCSRDVPVRPGLICVSVAFVPAAEGAFREAVPPYFNSTLILVAMHSYFRAATEKATTNVLGASFPLSNSGALGRPI